jgi:hypothetical protein
MTKAERELLHWTHLTCSGCSDDVEWAVRLANPEYGGSEAVLLCPTCIREAAQLLDAG